MQSPFAGRKSGFIRSDTFLIKKLYFVLCAFTFPAAAQVTAVEKTSETDAPPTAQSYVAVTPGVRVVAGRTLVPISFFAEALGATVEAKARNRTIWRINYFGNVAEIYRGQKGARFNGQSITLQAQSRLFGDVLYVPWSQLAELLGVRWKLQKNGTRDVMLLQYPAAYIQTVRATPAADKVRVVVELSKPTRIVEARTELETQFLLAAARREGVPSSTPVKDGLVANISTQTGAWKGNVAVRLNYAAPHTWFTIGNPPRLVIDFQKIFEESAESSLGSGLSLTKIRRGTTRGPVQLFLVRADPRRGWKLGLETGGFTTGERQPLTELARRGRSRVAMNGGPFPDAGAALGAVLKSGVWIRLPQNKRPALGVSVDGKARIGTLETTAVAQFTGGVKVPVREINGWADRNAVSVLTTRFRTFYELRPGEIGVVVRRGVITSKPGSGGVSVPADGFVLVATGSAVPLLNQVSRGQSAVLQIEANGWPKLEMALGAGPRLVRRGAIDISTGGNEAGDEVRIENSPRSAFGLDSRGRYLFLVVDGGKESYSTGLTLRELAATMKAFGASDAINLDGGASTSLAVGNTLINRPSEGRERALANALVITR